MRSIFRKITMRIWLCGVEGFLTEIVEFQWVLSSGNCMYFLLGNCVYVCWKISVFSIGKKKLSVLLMKIEWVVLKIVCFAEKCWVDVL